MNIDDDKVEKILNDFSKKKNIYGVNVRIEDNNGNRFHHSGGNLQGDPLFCIASITKMFTAAVIYQLINENKLSLDDTLDKFIDPKILINLHTYRGKNYASEITIEHLLSQTSGLPDFYTEKSNNYPPYSNQLFKNDIPITFEEIIIRTKQLKPHFAPCSDKAFYSDVNFELLGLVAEKVTSKTLENLYHTYIFTPLHYSDTFICKPDNDFSAIYFGEKELHHSKAISSMVASGGLISTTEELMLFLKAFMSGDLFPESFIQQSRWNRIQWYPLEYGNGMMRCKMSRFMSPFIPAPEIIGHSGSTGSFAFYCPDKNVHIVGTYNQIKRVPFQLIYQLLNCIDQ